MAALRVEMTFSVSFRAICAKNRCKEAAQSAPQTKPSTIPSFVVLKAVRSWQIGHQVLIRPGLRIQGHNQAGQDELATLMPLNIEDDIAVPRGQRLRDRVNEYVLAGSGADAISAAGVQPLSLSPGRT